MNGKNEPTIRFLVGRGNPSDEELAALTVVLATALAAPPPGRSNRDRTISGGWNAYWRNIRPTFLYGPKAWRGSLR
ncbi:hypothetical protein HMPREF1531_01709 [Propionibacterium sp. oral taxon 192 str. F0372]|uniref:acyl-CoA carboxylase subunit epsilon n=1 Tax=Propionibacterium sp. oral taxon 192 TaxID=671222 RepID=UPI0003533C02|nr:acyl-CoA carboxylase subunit epsilon [Propionibacterium sp. oral taxon 192]EPH02403.1 hypothetical protein HMPREF1531_01709 [Propionibacterium sp. oral taxon 192 str. F0372]